jgi:uncharacterized protein YndB with AHSA1/START domain
MSSTATAEVRKTVLVDFPPADAFDLFTAGIASWWPVRTHSFGGDEVKHLVFEPEVGGRVYEITDAGEQDWAKVRSFDPPHGFLLEWLIGESSGTEVEVTFEPEGPGSRVVLEHRGFTDERWRESYDGGWDVVLRPFAEHARR